MSSTFRSLKLPKYGKPSTTNKGSLLPVKLLLPLILICAPDPGLTPVLAISTPAALPCKAIAIFIAGTSSNVFSFTDTTDPVISFLRWVIPYPVTITSPRVFSVETNRTVISV